MDKKIKTKSAFFDGIKTAFRREMEKRRTSRALLLVDVGAFLVALFFARRHIVLGAYPLGLAWLSVLPSHVFIALPGAIIGSLSLGGEGVILAVSSSAVVIFRLICSLISGEGVEPFRENGAMLIGSCALGAAIGAGYEMILGSFSPASMIFASAEILLSTALATVLYGVFSYEMDISGILLSGSVFSLKRDGKERVAFLVYVVSLLSFVFLLTLALEGYDFFGISLAYLFVGALTLFVARRFGAVKAMAVGFFSAVGIDPVGAVGFALAGLVAGLLFDIGTTYGLVGGGAAISAWCAYAGGMSLFLSAIPEWSIASTVMIPYLKNAVRERRDAPTEPAATDREGVLDECVRAAVGEVDLSALAQRSLDTASVVRNYFDLGFGDMEDYRNAVIAATATVDPHPCEEKINELASLLHSKGSATELDIQRILEINYGAATVLASLSSSLRIYERELYKKGGGAVADQMEIQARLVQSMQARARESLAENDPLADQIISRLRMIGIGRVACRVLGGRKRLICLATEDDGVQRLKSREVISAIEGVIGTRLCTPSIKRRGSTLIFEAEEKPRLRCEVGVASSAARAGVPSGDNSCFFEREGIFYAVVADGMGTGEIAMQTSRLVCDYILSGALGVEEIEDLISSLNGIVAASGTECCASVDVFYLDLFTGQGGFIKAGAVPSLIKKGESVRRIRARSMPIGAMRGVCCERCAVEIGAGDVVVMLTDGVAEIPEESLWLLDAVADKTYREAQSFAQSIITAAKKNSATGDDMTALVIEIKRE